MEPGSLEFLKDGGEMGARMRALDWSSTGLGAPDLWPQSLKTIVRVMLDSRFACECRGVLREPSSATTPTYPP